MIRGARWSGGADDDRGRRSWDGRADPPHPVGARLARLRRRPGRGAAAGPPRRARLRRRRGGRGRDGRPARLRPDDDRGRRRRRAHRSAPPAAARRRADGRDRPRLRRRRQLRGDRGAGAPRHHQPLGRERQRLRAAGAGGADRGVARCAAHGRLRPLQPGRRARRGRWRARRRPAPRRSPRSACRSPPRCARCSCSTRCSAWPAPWRTGRSRPFPQPTGGAAAARAARAVPRHRPPPRRAVQRRRLRRRPRRAIAARALAVRAARPVAGRGRAVLLLVRHARGLFLPGRRVARGADRPREHDGVDAHPIEPLPDRRRLRPGAGSGARAAAAPRGAVADGRADPHLLRDGGGDAGRAHRGRELHRRPAQPRRRGGPGARRRPLRRRVPTSCRWSPAACSRSSTTWRCSRRSGTSSRPRSDRARSHAAIASGRHGRNRRRVDDVQARRHRVVPALGP